MSKRKSPLIGKKKSNPPPLINVNVTTQKNKIRSVIEMGAWIAAILGTLFILWQIFHPNALQKEKEEPNITINHGPDFLPTSSPDTFNLAIALQNTGNGDAINFVDHVYALQIANGQIFSLATPQNPAATELSRFGVGQIKTWSIQYESSKRKNLNDSEYIYLKFNYSGIKDTIQKILRCIFFLPNPKTHRAITEINSIDYGTIKKYLTMRNLW